MKISVCIAIIILFIANHNLCGQSKYQQSIQGKVTDKSTGMPLPAANVILEGSAFQKGIVTDIEGRFNFEGIKIGTYRIKVSYIGYEPYLLENIHLLSGKDFYQEIQLNPSAEVLSSVAVNAFRNKTDPRNNMALIGARSFTIEETNMFAGSYGDPARMAMNYAGVLPVRDNRNDIIIRGNSAFGLNWKVDNIEIPNPNHFGASGTTGGPIIIINNNHLARSDFFNSAFPAEYGNAIAGVFDIKLKTGNIQNHEKWLQVGWNGLELGFEGPIRQIKNASYIISYRHSIPDLIAQTGVSLRKKIDYKDLNFKLNIPGTKTGNWSLIGMGGNSRIILDERKLKHSDRGFDDYGEIIDNTTSLAVIGLTNKYYLNKTTKLESSIAFTGNIVKSEIDTVSYDIDQPFHWGNENTRIHKYKFNTKLFSKISDKASYSLGFSHDHFVLSLNDWEFQDNQYLRFTDTSNAQMDFSRVYLSYKRRLTNKTEMYLGINNQYLFINKSYSIEPRASIKYKISELSEISIGSGLHSQMQPIVTYFVKTENTNTLTNKNLDFTKSIHNVFSYDLIFNEFLRFKAELYYQHLYDVPVSRVEPAYSLINFGTEYYIERKDSLINSGKGQNYGIELTFERFFHNNYYYLITASIFNSKFKGRDGKYRNTAYNGQYATNILGGYRLAFPKKNVAMMFGANFTYAGGSPYVPYDVNQTVQNQRVMYDWERAYKVRRKDYLRFSFRIGLQRNFKRSSIETSIDLQYGTDYTNIYTDRINVRTGKVITNDKLIFYPMINSRFNF
jgi:hypothetical protein